LWCFLSRKEITQKKGGKAEAEVLPVERKRDTRPAAGIIIGQRDVVNPISKCHSWILVLKSYR